MCEKTFILTDAISTLHDLPRKSPFDLVEIFTRASERKCTCASVHVCCTCRNNGKYHSVYSRSFDYTINLHAAAAIKSSISFAFLCFCDVGPSGGHSETKYRDIN